MTNEMNSMEELLKEYDVKRIRTGDILKGTVIDVNDKEVTVNINYAFDGVITREELSVDSKNPLDIVQKDDEIEVYVLSPNDGEGYVLLSRTQALAVTEKEDIQDAYENNKTITVLVSEIVKGGIVAYYGSLRVFIPGSQISRERVDLEEFKNKKLDVKIIELNFKDRKIVASRRIIEEREYQEKKKQIWANIKEGEKREGIVKKIVKFGAFVDIGGVEGLIHLNDLAWNRVNNAEEVVSVGDKVQVFVGNIDEKSGKLSLILKDVDKEPWKVYSELIKENEVIEGKVVRLTSFGAFVEVYPGVEGLVHISEITDENIAKPADVLTVGQNVKVKILSVDKEEKKLSLSIKEAIEKNNEYLQYNDSDEGTRLGELFKDLKF